MRDPGVSEKSEKPKLLRLKRRADFVRAAKGTRWHGTALSLQAIPASRDSDVSGVARVGFTLTRKVGNAVVRNRARRRLREALRVSPGLSLEGGHDYVVIGRIDAVRLSFGALQDELGRAIAGVHRNRRGTRREALRQAGRDEPPKMPQRIRRTP